MPKRKGPSPEAIADFIKIFTPEAIEIIKREKIEAAKLEKQK